MIGYSFLSHSVCVSASQDSALGSFIRSFTSLFHKDMRAALGQVLGLAWAIYFSFPSQGLPQPSQQQPWLLEDTPSVFPTLALLMVNPVFLTPAGYWKVKPRHYKWNLTSPPLSLLPLTL